MSFNYNYDRGYNPCKKCKKRTVGCHSDCDAYDRFKKKIENINKKEKEDKSYNNTTGWGYIPRRKEK